jgi:hypothetical protein
MTGGDSAVGVQLVDHEGIFPEYGKDDEIRV